MNGKLKKLILFYVLMLSVILSQVGMSVYITALNWRVIEFSNSAFHIGVIATSMTLPQFLFSLMGGAIADNKDKLRSLRLILVLQIIVACAFSLISSKLPFNFIVTYAISFLIGTLNAIWQPVFLSYIPMLIPQTYVPMGMSLSLVGLYASRFLGPMWAGWLLKSFSPSTPFFVYCYSILIPLLMFFLIKLPSSIAETENKDLKKTFQPDVLIKDKIILPLWLITIALSLFIMSIFSIIPYFAKNVFGLDSSGMSKLMSSCGLGQLIGAVLSMAIGKRNETRFGRNQYQGYVLMGFFLLIFAISSNVIIAISSLMLMNVIHGVLSPRINTIIQTYVPESMRGKVQSMFLLVFGFVPFGQFLLGLITTPSAPRLGAIVYVVMFFLTLLVVRLKFDKLLQLQQENGAIRLKNDA